MIISSFCILFISKYSECICLCHAPRRHTRRLETKSPSVGGACILPISKSKDGFIRVKKSEYKLHGGRSFYPIMLSTDPTKRSHNVDVRNDLRAALVLSGGRVVEFSRVEPTNAQKPLTFSVVAAPNTNTIGGRKWCLKFYKLRAYWNQQWQGMKSAWLKLVVDQDCCLNIKITYDKDKRTRSKNKWEKQRNKVTPSF